VVMRKLTHLLGLALVLASGCDPNPDPDPATVLRQRMVSHGFEVGEMRTTVPASLAAVPAGKRNESRCAPARVDGRAFEMCLWRYPNGDDSLDWASGPDGKALPAGTHRHVSDEYVVLVAPLDGAPSPELFRKVERAVTGKP
jgi:hypothetical protein